MSELISLTSPESYRQTRTNLFPSPQSLLWFVRQNRAELIEASAIIRVAGRNLVHPNRCDEVVVRIGQRAVGKVVL